MKKFYLITMIVAFLFFCTNGMQAQTPQAKLNHVELMKQFLGNWKGEIEKDTILIAENKSFGNGMELYYKVETKGKIIFEMTSLMGYDKNNDRLIEADLLKYSNIVLSALWFTSMNTCTQIPYEYISNPEKAIKKTNYEFKSPDLFIQTDIVNNKPIRTFTYTRIKN